MKKILVFCFLIVFILIISLFIREIIINYDKIYDNSIKLSRDDIIKLLDKGAKNNNYYRSVNTENR